MPGFLYYAKRQRHFTLLHYVTVLCEAPRALNDKELERRSSLRHLAEAVTRKAIGAEAGAGVTPAPFAQADLEGRRKGLKVRGGAVRKRTSPA